jgi:hypothetical protein
MPMVMPAIALGTVATGVAVPVVLPRTVVPFKVPTGCVGSVTV